MEYLDETRPEPALLPKDPATRALVRQISLMVVADTQPLQNLSVLKKHGIEHKNEWAGWAISKGLSGVMTKKGLSFSTYSPTAIEKVLSGSAGKFCVGDNVSIIDTWLSSFPYCSNQLTMADLCLVPQLYNARRFDIDLTPYPTILRVEAAVSEIPEFKTSHPSAQPDTPADAK